jgi:hypothetical protein
MYKKLIKMNSTKVFKYFIVLLLILSLTRANAQISRIAILDFQNISGISKYDGLGKAMSSMLISDIESNISLKRLQFIERGQIQKILKEQNFQASTNVNKASIVETGKLLGVNYILIGDVYILNDQLIINARLTNVKTGEIVFSKKQEGKTLGWLTLKTNIAKEIAKTLSMPFTKPIIPDKEITMQTITTFGDAIEAKDNGNVEIAEKIIQSVQDFSPNFNYVINLKKEINEIKKRLENVEENLQITTTDPLTAAKNFDDLGKYADAEKYYLIGLNRLRQDQSGMYLIYNSLLAELSLKYKNYSKVILYCDKILEIYPFYDIAVYFKTQALIASNKNLQFIEWSKFYLRNGHNKGDYKIFDQYLSNYRSNKKITNINDISIQTSHGRGFGININNYDEIILGSDDIFSNILGSFCEINNKENGISSTLNFLSEINNQTKNTFNDFEFEQKKPYYIPKSRYQSGLDSKNENLIILKTGDRYVGTYFKDYTSKYWTKDPENCPCLRLVTNDEFIAINKKNIKENWQKYFYQSEAWYRLLSKDYKIARELFIYCISYQLKNHIDYNKNEKDIKIIDSLISNSKFDFQNLNYIKKSGIVSFSDDLNNDIINYGHTYVVEGNFTLAKSIYTLLDLNYTSEKYEMSIKAIIIKDLDELKSKGLITKIIYDDLINYINKS